MPRSLGVWQRHKPARIPRPRKGSSRRPILPTRWAGLRRTGRRTATRGLLTSFAWLTWRKTWSFEEGRWAPTGPATAQTHRATGRGCLAHPRRCSPSPTSCRSLTRRSTPAGCLAMRLTLASACPAASPTLSKQMIESSQEAEGGLLTKLTGPQWSRLWTPALVSSSSRCSTGGSSQRSTGVSPQGKRPTYITAATHRAKTWQ
mmetsp:Transcript_35425/g.100313  ORF Transcript_35425/g.100313 Transcript_35425/m.100313 type:complete len:203 (-) Transcript_35425:1360-1968(-)